VPELEVIATAAVAEAIAVAKASGIALETIHPHEAWMKEVGFVESDLDRATSLIEPESFRNPGEGNVSGHSTHLAASLGRRPRRLIEYN